MIEPIELRPGNYIHPGLPGEAAADTGVYLRVVSVDLVARQVKAKADYQQDIRTFAVAEIYPCGLSDLQQAIGGLAFGPHSILLQDEGVYIVHEEGPSIPLPHIRYVHQFQNLVRSLTGSEMAFNLAARS
ncbi:hypothetical protein [Taibaiella chishuiensis]|uniref:Uncharacterized protein n=1 Tax=Taibaiella chishuiensis TaxID=1434707 RepID=A0A2P8CXM6_9BACT|nr:hypothetical protein [Taibaiella chishuiensis]PSK89709.1 hypothetical protein B0I18_1108 [Taibaiella chishuiensis]